MKLPSILLLEETITDVIAAGPASKGIAKGNIEVVISFDAMDFSFRSDLLSNNISIDMRSNIIPPAILNEYKEISK